MKKTAFILIALAFIAISCGQTENKQTTINEKELLDTIGKITFEDNTEDCRYCESFCLDSFPKEWITLTMYENRYVIYNSCDGGNRLWKFSKKNNKYELLVYGSQEDYIYDIIKTYKFNDTIFIESRWKDSEQIINFKILWDKNKHLMHIDGYFYLHPDSWDLCVENKNAFEYEVYNQPCIECWGDECEEIENLKEK